MITVIVSLSENEDIPYEVLVATEEQIGSVFDDNLKIIFFSSS